MTPARWRQVRAVFESLRDLPATERSEGLREQCGSDEALREEVESLLLHHDQSRDFLEPASARVPENVPERLGRFEVSGVLGRGGMGVVYLARDPTLDRLVAIKVIPEGFARNRDRLMRFEREARILASLNHPNIATIHGLEDTEAGRVLVLEHIEGESLADRLDRGPLPLAGSLELSIQVARALEAAHARGVIHRDLKPDNIRITPEPQSIVKVLDFGLARRDPARRSGAGPSIPSMATVPGLVMGTPGYMSPEQARGKPTDERTDIFSLSCILYACLTGQPAFRGDTPSDCLAAVLKDDPDLSCLPAEAPEGLSSLLKRCLDKDPERRLPAMSHFRRELEALVRGPSGFASLTPFVGVASKAQARSNLPRSLTSFIGRASEVEAIRAALQSTSLLTLTGSGGCGKTRLAFKVAEELLPEFADGVWVTELASTSDPALVPSTVATATGIKEEAGRPIVATLMDRLQSRKVLLVLDNCEHLLSAVGDLVNALLQNCREVRMIATSREALGVPGELARRVSSLSVPDERAGPEDLDRFEATQLFLERARLAKADFAPSTQDAPIIARICRRLDGIPLALELAAARVKVLSVSQIHDKLSDRFRLLVGGARAALERHQTLRAAIDWSYGLLTPDERRTLRSLSVFSGGCSLEAAASVCNADEFTILDLLTHLVDKSLLIAEEMHDSTVRYRLLETVRQYARDRLHAAEDLPLQAAEASDRHLDYFLSLAESAEPALTSKDQSLWLNRLSAEHENLLAALDWCAGAESTPARDYPQLGLRMVGALARFWGIRGHFATGSLAAARALSRDRSPTEARAKALNSAGGLFYLQGDHARAGEAWQEALHIQRGLGNKKAQAGALNNLGLVSERQGNFDEARLLYAEALEINRGLDNRPWQAININNLANLAALQNDLDTAASGFREALRLNRELGNRAEEGKNLGNLGNVARDRADYAVARAYYADSLKLKRELGDLRGTAVTLSQVGLVEGLEGDLAAGQRHIAEALEALRGLGDKAGLAIALEDAACLANARADSQRTGLFLAAALRIRDDITSPRAGGDLRRALEAASQSRARDQHAFDSGSSQASEESAQSVIDAALAWLRS